MYYMLNIVTGEEDYPDAVLIRGLDFISDPDVFSVRRYGKQYNELDNYKKKNMLNGPGKITKAFAIDKKMDGTILGDDIYIEDEGLESLDIETTPRIGINYAEEWKDKPYRFVLK